MSFAIDSTRGVVTALGSRGLPPDWSPRDPDFFPQDENDLSSLVLFLDLWTGKGDWQWSMIARGGLKMKMKLRRSVALGMMIYKKGYETTVGVSGNRAFDFSVD